VLAGWMGCGASSGGAYEGGGAGDADADADDPKLREYLRMKGVDPNSTRELPSVGISPAEARRRGVTAGQTPGTAAATNARCACAAIHCRPVIVTASLYPAGRAGQPVAD
jgi:hypothetical protein